MTVFGNHIVELENHPASHRRDIPCLDGLRAISISLVLIAHLLQAHQPTGHIERLGQLGQTGVHVFFVISGYLITTLLAREYSRDGVVSVRGFMWRRITRILPAYGVYLFVIWALGVAPPGTRWWPALTYTSNVVTTNWWWLGHSWSLSVEEQFYLTWPWAIALLGPQRSRWVAALAFVSAPVIRVLLYVAMRTAWQPLFWDYDFIAAGALLALLRPGGVRLRFGWLAPIVVIGVSLLFAQSIRWMFAAQLVIGLPVEAIAIALTLGSCLATPQEGFAKVLNARPLRLLGLVSYSLYLWQQPFFSEHPPVRTDVGLLLALFIACASYLLVEKSGLSLRKWLPVFVRDVILRATAGNKASTYCSLSELPKPTDCFHRASEVQLGETAD